VNLVAEQGPGTAESGAETRLDLWLEEVPRSWRAILDVFIDVGQALASRHATGVVHEDIRIENIVVGSDGRGFCRDVAPASAGIGLAFAGLRTAAVSLEQRLAAADAVDAVTYLAPEQFRGGRADARSNQFSFCVALYRALYRQLPFDHDWAASQGGEQYTRRRTPLGSLHFDLKVGSLDRTTLMNLAREVLSENIRPAPEGVDVPVWLDQVIQQGLRADPDDRFASMDALLDDVVDRLDDGRTTGRVVRRRHPLAKWAILGGCGLLLLLGILVKIALWAR
jgi:serine/threonine protein kinase